MTGASLPMRGALEALHAEIGACRACELAGYLTHALPVAGRQGPPGARVMVIGQAPGRITVERGLMFGGPSGAALERWLQRAGFAPGALRREVYLSALTRCDPGRSPKGKGTASPRQPKWRFAVPGWSANWRSCARALSCWWVAWPLRRFSGPPVWMTLLARLSSATASH